MVLQLFSQRPDPCSPRVKPENVSQEQADTTHRLVRNVRLVPGYYGRKGEGVLAKPILVFDGCALRRLLADTGEWPNEKVDKDHPVRYTTVIRAPYWNKSTLRFEEGLICRACASQGWVHRDYGGALANLYATRYPIWGLPWRRYSQKGMRNLEQYGAMFKIQWFDGERRYVHEKPFEQWIWDEPKELQCISSLLSRCREKEIEFPEGQPFLHMWDHVSSEVEMGS